MKSGRRDQVMQPAEKAGRGVVWRVGLLERAGGRGSRRAAAGFSRKITASAGSPIGLHRRFRQESAQRVRLTGFVRRAGGGAGRGDLWWDERWSWRQLVFFSGGYAAAARREPRPPGVVVFCMLRASDEPLVVAPPLPLPRDGARCVDPRESRGRGETLLVLNRHPTDPSPSEGGGPMAG